MNNSDEIAKLYEEAFNSIEYIKLYQSVGDYNLMKMHEERLANKLEQLGYEKGEIKI